MQNILQNYILKIELELVQIQFLNLFKTPNIQLILINILQK
ncbi:hypothetical protein pb186bvf_015977 [Paramecium bursaria]